MTLAALEAGRRLALANKESLIAAGPVVQRARATPGAEIIPVDSRALRRPPVPAGRRSRGAAGLARMVLTASGGPFRGRTAAELAAVTIADALAHPTWTMGPKITVDSSTLMNKGLEVIEAHELFGVAYDRHRAWWSTRSRSSTPWSSSPTAPPSPSCRCPTCGCPSATPWPTRTGCRCRLRRHRLGRRWRASTSSRPTCDAFPCLGLAYEAGRAGGTAPAWLNAANEVAVAAFLENLIPWIAIADVVKETLVRHHGTNPGSVDVVLDADRQARELARRVVERRAAA